MASSYRSLLLLPLVLVGCSAIINPDSDRFGTVEPGVDAGPGVVLMDAGDVDAAGFDAGPPPDMRDAGPMIGDDAGSCTPSCREGVLDTCVGTETCPLGCASGDGAPRCAEMIPSNVPATLWNAAAPDLDLMTPGQVLFDTDECNAMSAMSTVVTQSGGGEVCVLQVGTLRIRGGTVLRPVGNRPLVIMATGEVRIDAMGAIDVSTYLTGDGERALGAGGALGGTPGRSAAGEAPGTNGTHEGSFDDGGGGGGAYCGDGGDGGDGGGGAANGEGGGAVPSDLLIPLGGGSAGGFGPGAANVIMPGTRGNVGLGGGGGGALQISTPVRIRLDGFIAAGGGGGLGGRNGSGNWGAGGGGGSGGGILLETPDLSLGTDWAITTTGGGGGGGASSTNPGGEGQNGVQTLGRATGGARGGVRYGADGGDSGGGADDDALSGESNTGSSGNGGGGGGGVGCIGVRTIDGALPPGFAARVSGRSSVALRSAPVMRQ